MGKVAFLFPGQGAQYVGMGKVFYKSYSIARQTYEEANEKLGFDIAKICFEGPEDELLLTENTQPAILTTSIAILRVLQQKGLTSDFTAGLSLGEYAALVNAGALDFSDAVKLVRNRGIYMQQAVPNGMGKMGAIVGLTPDKIEKVLEQAREEGIIEVANFNTPEQIVVSGEKRAVKRALKKAKELGARKALPLLVSAPFHCSLLKPAGELLKKDLDEIDLHDPKIPVVSNVDAKVVTDKKEVYASLIRQVSNSVLWQQSVELLLKEGVAKFIEIGPGTTLSNFVKAIAENMKMEVESESIGDLEML
ncbi:MAG: ACP S-malonyltransferase [Clostridiales bacterium]|nr:ACP S-malonyltransferase [Clostridiales bacterium]